MDFVAMRVRDLEVGDQVRRFNQADHPRYATVVALRNFPLTQRRFVKLEIRQQNGVVRSKCFTESAFAAIRIKRSAFCGVPCCPLHSMERGPEKAICRDHWKAWEGVA